MGLSMFQKYKLCHLKAANKKYKQHEKKYIQHEKYLEFLLFCPGLVSILSWVISNSATKKTNQKFRFFIGIVK